MTFLLNLTFALTRRTDSVCKYLTPSSLFQREPVDFSLRPQIRTATKRAGGSTKNNRGSAGRRLGVKKFGGEAVNQGEIIIRQRGQRFHPGQDVYLSKDHSLHAAIPGFVKFYTDPTGESVGYSALSQRRQRMRKFVGVVKNRNDQLPRALDLVGRARHFDLVDLAERERQLSSMRPNYRIPDSTFVQPDSQNRPLSKPTPS